MLVMNRKAMRSGPHGGKLKREQVRILSLRTEAVIILTPPPLRVRLHEHHEFQAAGIFTP